MSCSIFCVAAMRVCIHSTIYVYMYMYGTCRSVLVIVAECYNVL